MVALLASTISLQVHRGTLSPAAAVHSFLWGATAHSCSTIALLIGSGTNLECGKQGLVVWGKLESI